MQMLGDRNTNSPPTQPLQNPTGQQPKEQQSTGQQPMDSFDDDIPFGYIGIGIPRIAIHCL